MADMSGNSNRHAAGSIISKLPLLLQPVRWLQALGWLMYAISVGWFVLLSSATHGAAEDTTLKGVRWRTGRAFDEFSKSPISVSWQHAALRSHLMQFARSQQLAIVLDRRVDPNQRLDLTVKNVSIEQFMLRIAQASGTQFCRFGDCYYFGPAENAQRLLGINSILTGGRQSEKTVWGRSAEMSWRRLATPQEVLRRLTMENNFEIVGLDKIQHDLMAELNVPPMRLDMRLTLLLSQFDLWFKQNDSKKTVSIVGPPETLRASLRMTGYDADKKLLQRMRAASTSCKVTKTKRTIKITGPVQGLEAARNVAIGSFTPKPRSLDEKRFQLSVKNRRGLILNAVAQQLALEVQVADDCQSVLKEVVVITVKDATVDVLLEAILAGTECDYSQEGQTLRLYRK